MVPKSYSRWIFLVLGFLGFADTGYLTAEHFLGVIPPCSILKGCETVLTSQYATIAGIPVSLIGLVYYLLIFGLAVWYVDKGNDIAIRRIFQLTTVGFLISVFLVSVQIFVIKSICQYCMFSALDSTLLFAFSWAVVRKMNK